MQSPSNNLLKHFKVTESDKIGSGQESYVYKLGDDQVLKVYCGDVVDSQLDSQAQFYQNLQSSNLPFATPTILESGSRDGQLFTIEKQLPGIEFTGLLENEDALHRAVNEMLSAPKHFSQIPLEEKTYGQMYPDYSHKAKQEKDWGAFLRAVVDHNVAQHKDLFTLKLPDIEAIVSAFNQQADQLSNPDPTLVHGDFWFPNLLFGEDGRLVSVLNFNMGLMLRGDWLVDSVSASIFLRSFEEDLQFDLTSMGHKAFMELYPENEMQHEVYTMYYAFLFFQYEEQDPHLHEWCVDILSSVVTD